MSSPNRHGTHASYAHDQVQPAYDGHNKTDKVARMFDAIAPSYDRLNRIISLGLDQRWRRRLREAVLETRPMRVLDVATGTGDFALALAAAGVPEVVGLDVSAGMLAVGRDKARNMGHAVTFVQGDGQTLPYPDGVFDATTVVFGIRNFEDLDRGLAELRRVTRPGGLVGILELSTPHNPVLRRLHHLYSRWVLPRIGALLSGEESAYRYLPDSVAAFPSGAALLGPLERAGFDTARHIALSGGIAAIYLAKNRGVGA